MYSGKCKVFSQYAVSVAQTAVHKEESKIGRPVEKILRRSQGCTNPGRQVSVTITFCTVMPKICGSSVWNLLHVTILAPRILRWVQEFGKFLQSSKYSDNIARQLQNKSSNPVDISRNIYGIIRFPGNEALTAKKKMKFSAH